MRQSPEFFGDIELDLIYMAGRLREALKIEDLLTGVGIDYLVEPGPYTGGFLIKRDLTGAFFYVLPQDVPRTHAILREHRYRPYSHSATLSDSKE